MTTRPATDPYLRERPRLFLAGRLSTRFSELLGMPPIVYKQKAEGSTAVIPTCVAFHREALRVEVRNRPKPELQA